jgi:ABC-type nitrate/sulfonate/bicarbonate transport system substrate-binding protein
MRTREIDGIVDNYGVGLEAEESGRARILVRFADRIHDFHMYVIFARNDLIETKPDTVRAFLKGWFETIAFARTHRAETIEVVSAVTDTDLRLVDSIYEFQMSIFSDNGRFRSKALDAIRRSFVDLKILEKEPDMAKLYTDALLPAAGR